MRLLILLLFFLSVLPFASANSSYAIPINGRFHTLTIQLQIPSTPEWAHDTVLNATRVWNKAQLWFQQLSLPMSEAYNFTESKTGEVSVQFGMPQPYNEFAVGWTEYRFSGSTPEIIASAHVFLDGRIFNSTQESNVTARRCAFWIALHELGRVLGLGSVLDGKDLMDPRGISYLSTQEPSLSTLDLYAVQTLASNPAVPSFIYLPNTIQYQLVDAWNFLNQNLNPLTPATPNTQPSHDNQTVPFAAIPANTPTLMLTPERDITLIIAITLATILLSAKLKKKPGSRT